MSDEEYLDFQKKSEALSERMKNFSHKLDTAISINKIQKNRLIELEDQLLSVSAEVRSLEKQLTRKRFSIKNLFKRN